MKIEQTKLYKEFKIWVRSQYEFGTYDYKIFSQTFDAFPFNRKEGYYRSFLRERGWIVMDVFKVPKGTYSADAVSEQHDIVNLNLRNKKTYEQAFMNLVETIFNQPK